MSKQAARIIQFDESATDTTVNSVHETNEYEKFTFNSKNRAVNPAHLDKLKASIKSNNLLRAQPILVNRGFEIIDGQHRFTAARELGVPIFYIMEEGLGIEDAITLNINTKNWTWRDYLQYWIDQGRDEYVYFRDYMETYGISYSVCCGILGLGEATSGNKLTDVFNSGKFKAKYKDYGHKIGERIKELSQWGGFTSDRSFVLAFDDVLKMEEFDYSEFVKKVSMAPDRFTRCSNTDNYLRMMEEVYNYNRHGERIRLY